jgi:two-component system response regulator RegX3
MTAPRPTRVLVVEDDPAVRLSLRLMCQKEGVEVLEAPTGPQALASLEGTPDLVLLDLMLPGMDGLEVCRRMRRERPSQPVIILTARGDEGYKVTGLELGADDYVTKPFSPRELLARMRAVLRRATRPPEHAAPEPEDRPAPLTLGSLALDLAARIVTRDGQPVALTRTEFDLLAALAQQPGRAYTRAELVSRVWGYADEGGTRLLDSHIGHLRAKVEPDPAHPSYVRTVRGIGYRLCEPERSGT